MKRVRAILERVTPRVQLFLAGALGLLLVAGPWLIGSPTFGDDLTRNTIRLALGYYALSLLLMLCLTDAEWAGSGLGQSARLAWTLACVIYVIHVGVAFHYAFAWSHAAAFAHTAARSGVGEGVYVSYAFTLLWSLDVLAWWLTPRAHARRPAWIGKALHGFMLFLVFNGTVVYETGWIRWAGLFYFVALSWSAFLKWGLLWGPSSPGVVQSLASPRSLSCTEDLSRDCV